MQIILSVCLLFCLWKGICPVKKLSWYLFHTAFVLYCHSVSWKLTIVHMSLDGEHIVTYWYLDLGLLVPILALNNLMGQSKYSLWSCCLIWLLLMGWTCWTYGLKKLLYKCISSIVTDEYIKSKLHEIKALYSTKKKVLNRLDSISAERNKLHFRKITLEHQI